MIVYVECIVFLNLKWFSGGIGCCYDYISGCICCILVVVCISVVV